MNQRGHPESCSKCILYSSKNNTFNIRMNKVEMLICLETFHPPPFPIHTLNKWRKIASWAIFAVYNPSTLQNKTISIPRKLTCRVSFQICPSRSYKEHSWIDPTNQYIQHMDQVDMLIHSFGFTCPVPYKTLYLTYESAWHLDLCENVPCLPLQQHHTLNTWKKESWVISEIYSPSTLQSNTLNIWRDFAWRVMLGISVPSTLPHTWFKVWRKLPCGVIFKIYISLTLPS